LRDINVGDDPNETIDVNDTSDDDIDNSNTLYINISDGAMFNVLVTTNAANVGIDKQIIHVICCTSLSRDTPTMV
jgi:hypothetical protein